MSKQITELFFEECDNLKRKGANMKRELKCVRCGCPIIVGKHLYAKYTCPSCQRQYVIHRNGALSIEGQI